MNLELNKKYKFETKAPNTLGSYFENMMYIGELTYDIAINFGDIYTINNSIKNEISNMIPIEEMKFLLFKNMDTNEKIVLSTEWINESTITPIDITSATIKVDDISYDDVQIIRDTLHSLGYNKLTIKLST